MNATLADLAVVPLWQHALALLFLVLWVGAMFGSVLWLAFCVARVSAVLRGLWERR